MYSYDNLGNITVVNRNGNLPIYYTYDAQNQLVSVSEGIFRYDFTYDTYGNILSVDMYEEGIDEPVSSNTYSYNNPQWVDQLSAFNGHSITYDEIGNPLTYYNGSNYEFTWKGSELSKTVKGNTSVSYRYGADGLRTQKTVGSTVYDYYYADGVLVRQTWGTNYMDFLYDESGSPYSFIYNGTQYYYIKNLQGDVMRIVDATGAVVANYSYDAWGKVTNSGNVVGQYNPIRYRGYYYDTDTGFYYLQSRYYDSAIKRFINSDSVVPGVGGEVLGYNQYAYCINNPVNLTDEAGFWPKWVKEIGQAILELYVNRIDAFLTSFELEAGLGWGLDVNISDNATIGMSRDTFIGIDDGMLITGNTITAETSILDSDLSVGDSYRFVSEKGGVRSSSGTASDGPFDMINYPDVERGKQFAIGPFAISDSGDFLISIGIGGHVIVGGYLSAAFNVSEYFRRLFD